MKYALLIYTGTMRETTAQLPEDEQQAIMGEYRTLAQEPGVFSAQQLHPADSAKTVLVEDGQARTTDGSFVNEDIGGLYLLEADDIDRALEFAARFPAARFGGAVEVRPIVER